MHLPAVPQGLTGVPEFTRCPLSQENTGMGLCPYLVPQDNWKPQGLPDQPKIKTLRVPKFCILVCPRRVHFYMGYWYPLSYCVSKST